jgi:hypothetical protein
MEIQNQFFYFSHPPHPVIFFFVPSWVCFWEGKKRRGGREKEMEDTGDDSVEPVSGVQRKWLLSSEHWEVQNVFSLPQIK